MDVLGHFNNWYNKHILEITKLPFLQLKACSTEKTSSQAHFGGRSLALYCILSERNLGILVYCSWSGNWFCYRNWFRSWILIVNLESRLWPRFIIINLGFRFWIWNLISILYYRIIPSIKVNSKWITKEDVWKRKTDSFLLHSNSTPLMNTSCQIIM